MCNISALNQFVCSFRSYYESNDLTSALGVIEEALLRHPSLVTDDFINMAAELYIANRQYKKALQVPVGAFLCTDTAKGRCVPPY